MSTIGYPFVPPAEPTTTKAPVALTTTAIPNCSPTSPALALKARSSQKINIPRIGFASGGAGRAKLTKITIGTIPATGTLAKGGVTLANTNDVLASELDSLTYQAPSNFAGATFTYTVVTTCGTTATVTATITKEADPANPCGDCITTTVITTTTP